MTVTEALGRELSAVLESLARTELDKTVRRWKQAKEEQGYKFTEEQGDVLISYYDQAKKTIMPTYRLLVGSRGMEAILKAETFSELEGRLESIEKGRVREFVVDFTSRDLHLWMDLKDSFILRPYLTIGGTDRSQLVSLSREILRCFASHRNINSWVDNSVSLLLFPFVLGFLLLNAIFRCLGGVSLTDAFLFGLFLNVPLFLLLVVLIRKGFPLVDFRLTPEEMGRVNVPKMVFFLVALAIPAFSILTRLL